MFAIVRLLSRLLNIALLSLLTRLYCWSEDVVPLGIPLSTCIVGMNITCITVGDIGMGVLISIIYPTVIVLVRLDSYLLLVYLLVVASLLVVVVDDGL
jgi:hypothetical protein